MTLPAISIIAATRNRQSSLDELIASCAALDYPPELVEVIVVDDDSEPPARAARTGLRVRVLRQRHVGPASALNAGARAASGELIAITGDDCRPQPDWLRALVRAWAGNGDALIGGRTRDALAANAFSRASQSLIECLQDYSERTSSTNHHFFPATNLACSRARFLDVGGFDEISPVAAGEDRDLCYRWRAIGPLISAPDAVVDCANPLSAVEFLATHFRCGWGARILRVRRAPQGGDRFRLEPLPFYLNLVAFPFRSSRAPRAAVTAALLLAAQACTSAGYLYQACVKPIPAGLKRIADPILRPFRVAAMRRNLRLLNDTLAATPIAGRYWIIGGLLIGYAREGGVLTHDADDADFGIQRKDLARLFEAAPALEAAGFRLAHRYLDNAGEVAMMTWRKDNARFDFNVHDGLPEFCRYTCFGTLFPEGRLTPVQISGQVPAYELARFEFLGRTWLKPADHDRYLSSIYGDWRTPQLDYDYRTDDKSIVAVVPWLRHYDTGCTAEDLGRE